MNDRMRGWMAVVYGLAAYLVAMAVLAWFVGFSGNLWVPRSVDVGPRQPWPVAFAVDAMLLALFGLQHSVMARQGFKAFWTRVVPEAIERSTFLVATSAVLVVLFVSWLPIEVPVIWNVQHPAGRALLWSGFGLGWALAVASTYLLDHFELFGLRQVHARLAGRPSAEPAFRTPLLYRRVRHPLYLGFLLGFWSVPLMTAGRLLFSTGLTLYILVGIAFEERDMVRRFGERYRRYQRQVGMLLPRWGSGGAD